VSVAQVRRLSAIKACHNGPGIFDDFKFLFDPDERSTRTAAQLVSYEAKFQSFFRLSVKDYLFVRRHIEPDLHRRQDGRGRPPLGVDLIMATALVFLAHGTTYLVTAALMRNGLSEASTMRCVCLEPVRVARAESALIPASDCELRCIRLFTKSVRARLQPALISFPTSIPEFERCARAFFRRSGIPSIIGAIDGSHIRVAPPKRHQKSYYNRKKFYSVILSAVCDARGAFLSCDVGYAGRMSDSRVLK
jgi:hypothetical protein